MDSNLSLAELQKAFYKAVFEPAAAENSKLYEMINPVGDLSGEQLLNVYRESILGGLTEALTNIYPVCVKLVGEKFFTHMVAEYLVHNPSSSPDLGDYGEKFSSYIAEFEPVNELEYLADVASLEWCWHRAFNASDNLQESARPLTSLTEVAEVDQGRILFFLTPSAFLIHSEYPIQQIWQVNQEDYQGDGMVNLDDGGVYLVVWRNQAFGMRIDVLTEQEFIFLQAVRKRKPFADIAKLPCAHDLSGILARCIQTGLLAGFELVN